LRPSATILPGALRRHHPSAIRDVGADRIVVVLLAFRRDDLLWTLDALASTVGEPARRL